MIAVVTPGHPVQAGACYDCCCGECEARRVTLASALRDAIAYREALGGAECAHCEASPDGLCDDHGEDLALAGGYRVIARELGSAP